MRARDIYRQCSSKNRYRSEKVARRYARRIAQTRGVTLRVYECPICRGYHLTSQPLREDPHAHL